MKEIDFSKLKEPFDAIDIEWRLQSCGESNGKIWGKCLAYVTNRAIQNRLDEVCGPENWKNEFVKGPDGGILCGISIKCNDEWVTKWDGAENTAIEAVKGGLSDSMKRAAVQWSIGRYLYNLEEGFAEVTDKGEYRGKTKEGKWFSWNPPKLPAWALPMKSGKAEKTATTPSSPAKAVVTDLETKKAIETLESYIKDGKLNKDWIGKAQMYINTANLEGINKTINYIEGQMKVESAFDNA